MMMIGARAVFCAGHKLPQHPSPHGHSYEVWAYTGDSGCAEEWQRRVAAACAKLDHKMLNDVLVEPPTMENIARFLVRETQAHLVRVIRPLEGLCAEYRTDPEQDS